MPFLSNYMENALFDLTHGANGNSDIIRPKQNCPHSLPKEIEMQKTNRKQPPRKPREGCETMLFNLNFFHKIILIINGQIYIHLKAFICYVANMEISQSLQPV